LGFFIFGEANKGPLYGFLPSADLGQVVYFEPSSFIVNHEPEALVHWI